MIRKPALSHIVAEKIAREGTAPAAPPSYAATALGLRMLRITEREARADIQAALERGGICL